MYIFQAAMSSQEAMTDFGTPFAEDLWFSKAWTYQANSPQSFFILESIESF